MSRHDKRAHRSGRFTPPPALDAPALPPPAAPEKDPSRRAALLSWLDSRTGYRALLRTVTDEPVPGGASWAYVFGSLLTFVLLNQMITGALLGAFYAPSATDAWASVAYIQDQVWLGWFIRGLHAQGASAMVVLLLCHLLQVTIYGAYRAPREMSWLTGLFLLCLVMGFALTGYLLPWDQKGYWATQVATTLLGATPLIGRTLQTLVQGGPAYGNLTLTHFFAIHVFVLPAVVVLLLVGHIALFRRHGLTPRWGQSPEELSRKTVRFWPRQGVRDLLAMALLFGAMGIWVIATHGAELTAPADPTSSYEARPEWYFLPLYELLKYFPGPLEVLGALGGPLLVLGLLGALPWLDKAPGRDPALRKQPIALCLCGVLLLGTLGGMSLLEDAQDARFKKNQKESREQANRARHLALSGVLPAGGTAVYLNDPLEGGQALFAEHCAACHVLGTQMRPEDKDIRGPDLTHWSSRGWIGGFLREPHGPSFFGTTKVNGMKPVRGPEPELRALIEYVYSLTGDDKVDPSLAEQGKRLFAERGCDTCHERDGKTEGEGPNLKGRGSAAWVRGLLLDPASPLYYGEDNDMPGYAKKLDEDELDKLSAFVAAQRYR